jgi:hypothetical protein
VRNRNGAALLLETFLCLASCVRSRRLCWPSSTFAIALPLGCGRVTQGELGTYQFTGLAEHPMLGPHLCAAAEFGSHAFADAGTLMLLPREPFTIPPLKAL